MSRETWSTRSAFVLAAIGSAVGLGNLWGFPYKLYTYGGGAFLIPYFVAMLIMGIPLLIMEFAVGHWAQQAPPDAFGSILKRYRFVGWWLVALAFVIITYYAVILGYCVDYLIVSIKGFFAESLPWAEDAPAYFVKTVTPYAEKGENPMTLGAPVPLMVMAMLASWAMIYLCLFKGVKWVSKVVLLTVPLPWIMLLILTIRGLTLDGAITGLEFYLEPRWTKLMEPETWRYAFAQVFFSMSLGFAVMLSYASFLHRKSDLNNNALVIGLGDMATSFVAGIAVFSMLGAMALEQGVSVTQLVPGDSTVGLSFMVFPYGLSRLPGSAFFCVVFFLALLTLGIDSAFSIVEACLASICDSKPKWPRKYVLPGICIAGAAIGVVFTCGKGGVNWLGLVDGLINGPFGILIVALAECVIVGWAWKGDFVKEMRKHANERSDWTLYGWWDVIVKYVAPALLSILLVWSVSGEAHREVRNYKASHTQVSDAYQQLELRLADDDKYIFEGEQAEIEVSMAALKSEGAQSAYSPPVHLFAGMIIFVLIPLAAWFFSRGRKEADSAAEKKGASARAGVLYVSCVMALSGLVIEFGHMRHWFDGKPVEFKPNGQLDGAAYVFLTVGLVVIFGGLAWCFWKAMQAAGRQDPDMEEETS